MSHRVGTIVLICIGLYAAPAAAQARLPVNADAMPHRQSVIDFAEKPELSRGDFGEIGFASFSATESASGQRVVTAVRNVGQRSPSGTGILGRVAPSRLPEPASWALMLIGFGAIGAVMRRRHIASEAAFTEKVRAIAASGEAQGPY